MNKHLIPYFVIALAAFMVQACTSSEQPAKPEEQIKKEVKQQIAKEEELPRQAVQSKQTGENLFNENCKKCHRNGGNIINPKKTLYSEVLASNNIRTPEDIVYIMRNPGKGMPRFDENRIPDRDARKIGEYILQTFK